MMSIKSPRSVFAGEFVALAIAGWTNMNVRQFIRLLSLPSFLTAATRLSKALASFCRPLRFRSRAIDSGKATSSNRLEVSLTKLSRSLLASSLSTAGPSGLSFSMFPDTDLTSLLYFSVMPLTTSRDSLLKAIEIESDPWITATSWPLPFPPSIFANLTGTVVMRSSTSRRSYPTVISVSSPA